MHHFVRGVGLIRVGAVTSGTVVAGQALVAYFNVNPCTQSSLSVVSTFQTSWNADNPTNTLKVDGQYGPLTEGALQTALGTTAVPPNCFGGPAQQPIPPAPTPSPTPTPTPSTQASSGSGPLPYIIGTALVAGALAAYTYSRRKKGRHV